MKFKPSSDNFTVFLDMRLLKFDEDSIEVKLTRSVLGKQVQEVYKNTKPIEIYYNTNTLEIMNTLELVKLKSEKFKTRHTLQELICLTNLERVMRDWIIKKSVEVS